MKKITLLICGIFLSSILSAQINSSGLQFDGIDDYVRIPTIPAYNIGTGNFTIEIWLRMNTYQVGGSTFLLNIPGPNINFDPSTLAISLAQGMFSSSVNVIVGGAPISNSFFPISFNDHVCHHLTIVRSGGSLSLYKDGLLFQSQSVSGSVTVPNYIQLGTIFPMNSYGGFMQEFRFWNVARTQSQIQANMNTSPSGAGLIGYWRLDGINTINNTTWDYSINSNPGQVFGPTLLAGCSNCTLPADTIYAPNSTVGCNSVQLVAQPGNTNYKWYKDNFGNAILVSIGSSTYSATVSETYFCIVTNSCGSVMTNKKSVTVQTGPPTATITGPSTLCSPGSVILIANTGPSFTYHWLLNGGNIPGATTMSYTATTAGNYDCIVTNLCGSTVSNTIPVFSSGPCDLGLQFTNSNTRVTIPDNAAYGLGGGNFTLEAWIQASSSQLTTPIIVSKKGAFANGFMLFLTSGRLNIYLSGNSFGSAGPDLRDNICHHIAVTRVAGTVKRYVDGILVGTNTGGVQSINVAHDIWIGLEESSLNSFNGLVHEFRFWNIERTQAQIQASKDFFLSGTESGLIGYWRMNDGSGQMVQDFSATNNSGVLGTSTAVESTDPVYATACVTSNPCVAPPAVITAAGPTSVCVPGTVTLYVNTGPGLFFQWRLNGGNISGATATSYTATATGSYDCVVTNACGSVASNTIAVAVNPLPAISISAAGPTTFCVPGSVTLNANPSSGLSYQWRLNNVDIPGATSSSYIATAAGSYRCRGSDANCSANSNAISVTVISSAPAPTITAGGPTTFCAPGSVVLSVTLCGTCTYQWRNNGVNISGATSSTRVVTVSGIYDCIVTNACGSTTSNAIAVTVDSPPTATITASGPTSFCAPGSVVLNVNTGTSYQWRLNSVNISGATASSYTATAGGNYDCIVSNSCGSITSNVIVVTVNTAPTATITAGGPTTFCAPGSVTLNANTGAELSYQWILNTGIIPGATLSSYSATVSGSYDCMVSNSCGSATSNTITVTVNPAPIANITAAGPTTFCAPGSVTLNANTGPGLSYQWRLNGGNITGATSSSYIAASTGNYDCVISNSCGNVTSNVITVTVNPAPTATITAGGPTTFCTPGSVTLNANTGAGLSYQWRLNSGNIPGATSASYNATSSGTYTCVVSNSCGSATSNAITVTVSALPATPGSITGQATGVCSSTRTYSISPVSGATGYTWTVPAGASISSGQGTVSVNVAFTSSFASGSVSVAATNSCGTSSVSSLIVTGAPAQPGTITGPASVCHNQNNVIYNIAAVTGATSYTWTAPPGTQIKNGQGTTQIRVRFGNSAGNITVRANNACGQSPLRTLAIAMPCREEIADDNFDVTLYPNPATDKLNVICYTLYGNETVKIFNAVGESVLKSEIKSLESEIDVSTFPAGIYFAEIISGEQKKVLKFIKQE